MKPARDLTALEVLEIAIKAEIDAAALYRKMISMVKNRDLKSRLEFLENEEKNHQRMFEAIYRKQFPDVDLDLPKQGFVPGIDDALNKDLSIKEIFEVAMLAEQRAEEFYNQLAESSSEISAVSTFQFLAKTERGHYDLLKNELDYIEKFPEYHQSEFFGIDDDLFHVGP